MSQNCNSSFATATVRDANNNTLYHRSPGQDYGNRGFNPPNSGVTRNRNYQCNSYTSPTTRDANNNTLYQRSSGQSYGGRNYNSPSSNVTSNGNYQQVTAKVLFGSVNNKIQSNKINRQDTSEREVQRTH